MKDHFMFDMFQSHLNLNEKSLWFKHQDNLSASVSIFSQIIIILSSLQLTHTSENLSSNITFNQSDLTITAVITHFTLKDCIIFADLIIDNIITSRSLNCMWEIMTSDTETDNQNCFSLKLWESLLQKNVFYNSSIHEIISISDIDKTQIITFQQHFSVTLTHLFQSSNSDNSHFIIQMKQFSHKDFSLNSQLLQDSTFMQ